jgi:hypothetical protein
VGARGCHAVTAASSGNSHAASRRQCLTSCCAVPRPAQGRCCHPTPAAPPPARAASGLRRRSVNGRQPQRGPSCTNTASERGSGGERHRQAWRRRAFVAILAPYNHPIPLILACTAQNGSPGSTGHLRMQCQVGGFGVWLAEPSIQTLKASMTLIRPTYGFSQHTSGLQDAEAMMVGAHNREALI